MKIRAKKSAGYKQDRQPQVPAQNFTFPSPIRGWVLNESLLSSEGSSARVLDNYICSPTTLRARKGYQQHARVATGAPVTSLFAYKSGSSEKLFGAIAGSVFDISAPADPNVAPTAAFSGQSSGYYSFEQFGTAGGEYLYAVNGTDSPRLFDGSTWTAITGVSSPAITGVTTSGLSHVWAFANRLFFVEKGTMNAWYLGVDSIGGAANPFSLAGVFTRGGSLLFGATWSLDSGDGLDDKCVFVSTEGEVAVYEGTNPGDATKWSKVGVYQITRPLGQNATMRAGGDLLISTEVGLVPVSEAIRRDVAALSLGAVTRNIEPYWQKRAKTYSTLPWEIIKWPSENIMIVSQPETSATSGTMLVANLQTGSWSRFTGTDARCLGFFNGYAYFGDSQGAVHKMQTSGADDGMPYTAALLYNHDSMGIPGAVKTIRQARAIYRSNTNINPKLTAQVNYSETTSTAPPAFLENITEGWDVSTWDVSVWDAPSGSGVLPGDSQWVSIGRTGYAIAPELQITFGGVLAPDVELIGIEATFTVGAVVV